MEEEGTLTPKIEDLREGRRSKLKLQQVKPVHQSFPTPYAYDVPMVDKTVDATWKKELSNEKFAISKASENYALSDPCKTEEGFSMPIVFGGMAVVMGICTMLRVTHTSPSKIIDMPLNSTNPAFCAEQNMLQQHMPAPTISVTEYSSVMKHLSEMEEKVSILSRKPAEMAPEKEEMLNAAMKRVDTLEEELQATKKALEEALS